MKASGQINDDASTAAAGATEYMQNAVCFQAAGSAGTRGTRHHLSGGRFDNSSRPAHTSRRYLPIAAPALINQLPWARWRPSACVFGHFDSCSFSAVKYPI
ncbi:hypothetical protein EVAR_22718_1 [Eumeta japonica]|uniref:Uncharacterized protein n=1 Tax=Eumeta variegata TaxID=151549 RepID=A0A4C1UTM9_EUMVA|nr:hypothetical protein EVAR_22718_1 [Eumeta japonica]